MVVVVEIGMMVSDTGTGSDMVNSVRVTVVVVAADHW